MCDQLLDHYVDAISNDMDNFVHKHHKSMDMTYAHNDISRVLAREEQLTAGVLAGMVAAAILKEIAKKRKGKG